MLVSCTISNRLGQGYFSESETLSWLGDVLLDTSYYDPRIPSQSGFKFASALSQNVSNLKTRLGLRQIGVNPGTAGELELVDDSRSLLALLLLALVACPVISILVHSEPSRIRVEST